MTYTAEPQIRAFANYLSREKSKENRLFVRNKFRGFETFDNGQEYRKLATSLMCRGTENSIQG